MKIKKAIGRMLGILLLLAALVPLWLGPMVKQMVQCVGTKALGTPVQVNHLSINPLKGTLHLDGFSIANPNTFRTPHAVTVANLDIAIEMASLFSPTITVQQIRINSPHVVLEQSESSINTAEFIQSLRDFSGYTPDAPPTVKEPKPDSKKPAPIVMVQSLEITDTQLLLANTADPLLDIGAGIDKLGLSMTNGLIRLEELQLDNPAGFHAENLFHLAAIEVALDPASIFSGQVVINQVVIDSPEINLEQNDRTGNLTELQKSIQRFIPPKSAPPEAPPTHPPVSLAEQPVILEHFIVSSFAIHAILPPSDLCDTNKPTGLFRGKLNLKTMNPMTYIPKWGSTNETAQAEEMTVLAFDRLHIEPLSGSVEILNLRAGNPPQFSHEHLLKLDRFLLELDPDTLESDTLIIKEIHLEKPHVVYERKIRTDNLTAFQDTLSIAAIQQEERTDDALEKQAIKEAETKRVIIEHLIVQGGTVRAKISKLPTTPLPLPTIEMKNIGKEEGGASLSEASTKIFSAFYDAIIGVAANATGYATDSLKGAGSLTTDTLGSVVGTLGGLIGLDDEEKSKAPEK